MSRDFEIARLRWYKIDCSRKKKRS